MVIIDFRDDMTAGDGARKESMGQKGYINSIICAKIFETLEDAGVETQLIELCEPCVMKAKKLDMIPIEVIVRNIATGSIIRKFPFEDKAPFNPPLIQMDFKDDEFGKDKDGNIILGDEISPDSCRLWDAETLDMLDKELFRQGKDDEVIDAYEEVFNRLLTEEDKEKWGI